jgi:hypothetical protein
MGVLEGGVLQGGVGAGFPRFSKQQQSFGRSKILYIKWNFVRGSFVVVVVFYVPTIQYSTTAQILFENSFRRFRSRAHALSSGSTSKNASKNNSPQAAKETAHVNAISYQSFLWVFVNEFMSSIVSTNAEGRLLESAEERSRITQLIVVANYKMRWTR